MMTMSEKLSLGEKAISSDQFARKHPLLRSLFVRTEGVIIDTSNTGVIKTESAREHLIFGKRIRIVTSKWTK